MRSDGGCDATVLAESVPMWRVCIGSERFELALLNLAIKGRGSHLIASAHEAVGMHTIPGLLHDAFLFGDLFAGMMFNHTHTTDAGSYDAKQGSYQSACYDTLIFEQSDGFVASTTGESVDGWCLTWEKLLI